MGKLDLECDDLEFPQAVKADSDSRKLLQTSSISYIAIEKCKRMLCKISREPMMDPAHEVVIRVLSADDMSARQLRLALIVGRVCARQSGRNGGEIVAGKTKWQHGRVRSFAVAQIAQYVGLLACVLARQAS